MDAETFHNNLRSCGWHNIRVQLNDSYKLALPAEGVELSWDSSYSPLVRPPLLAQEDDIPFYVTGLKFDAWPWNVLEDVTSKAPPPPPHLVLRPVDSIDRESLRNTAALHSWCIEKGVALVAHCTLSTPSLRWKTLLVPACNPGSTSSPRDFRFHLYFLPYNPLTDYRQPSADGTAQALNTTWLRSRCTPKEGRGTHMDMDLQRWRKEREELRMDPRTGLPAVECNVTFSGYTNPDASGYGYLARVHRLPAQCAHMCCVQEVVPGMPFQYVVRPLKAVAGAGTDSSQHQSGDTNSRGGASQKRGGGARVMRQGGHDDQKQKNECSGGSGTRNGPEIWAQWEWQEHLEVVSDDEYERWLQPCDCNSKRHAAGNKGKEGEDSNGEALGRQGRNSTAYEERCAGLRARRHLARLRSEGTPFRLDIRLVGPDRGLGVVSLQDIIPEGSFVGEYVGVHRTKRQVDELERHYSAHGLQYIFGTKSLGVPRAKKTKPKRKKVTANSSANGEGEEEDEEDEEEEAPFVDATHVGNFTRFINHSCNPNLKAVNVCTGGVDRKRMRLVLEATRDIAYGEELLVDYYGTRSREFTEYVRWKGATQPGQVECRCGYEHCAKYLFVTKAAEWCKEHRRHLAAVAGATARPLPPNGDGAADGGKAARSAKPRPARPSSASPTTSGSTASVASALVRLALSRPMGPRPQQTNIPAPAAAAAAASGDGKAGEKASGGGKGSKKRLRRSEGATSPRRAPNAARPEIIGGRWTTTGVVRVTGGGGGGGGAPLASALPLRALEENGPAAAANGVPGRTPVGAAAAAAPPRGPSTVRRAVPVVRAGRPPLASPVAMPALPAAARVGGPAGGSGALGDDE